jgi:translocation and assembly module TamB
VNWKKSVLWAIAIAAAIVVTIVLAAIVLLESPAFQRYAFRLAGRKAAAAVGAPVEVQGFSFHPSRLSLDLYGLRLLGAKGHPYPPLFEADHVGLSIKIISALRLEWQLENLTLDHPVLRVLANAQGNTNIPSPQAAGGKRRNVFRLGVQHASLNRGELYYNNQKSLLSADFRDLTFESGFDPKLSQYEGSLAYRDGQLQYKGHNPLPHSLRASFVAAPEKFTLQHATLTSGPSRLDLSATAENYRQPRIEARYSAVFASEELRLAMRRPDLPLGLVQVHGTLHYQSQPNRPLLDSVAMTGDITSPKLDVRTPTLQMAIHDLGAHYEVEGGNAELRDLHAGLWGGELNGSVLIRHLTAKTASQLSARLQGISMTELKQLAGPRLHNIDLKGSANANLQATWGRTMQDLIATADASLQTTVAPVRPGGTAANAGAIPLNATVHARYVAATQELTLSQTFVRAPETSLILEGTVSNRSSLQVRLQANDLHRLEAIAGVFQKSAQSFELAGQASFIGAVRGATNAPHIFGELNATNVRFRGTSWRRLHTMLDVSPSEVRLQNGVLEPEQGHITFNLHAGLHNWAFTPTSVFAAEVAASRLHAAELVKTINAKYPVSGLLSANLSVHGSELNPIGNGTVELTNGRMATESVQALNAKFQAAGTKVDATLTLHIPAGVVQGRVTYWPKTQAYEGSLQAANLLLTRVEALQNRRLSITGLATIGASGHGTLQNPEAQLKVQTAQLELREHAISALTLSGTLHQRVATLALDSQILQASVHAHATIEVGGDYNTRMTLDTSSIPIQPLAAAYMPVQAPDIQGNTEVHASLQGPLKKPAFLNAHLEIPLFTLKYKTLEIGAGAPIRLDYASGVLRVEPAQIRGTGTDLQVQGTIPLKSTAPATLSVAGNADLRLMRILVPDVRSRGQLRFDIGSTGTLGTPSLRGQVQIVNASLETPAMPVGLQNGNGVLTLRQNHLEVTQFQADLGGGKLTASGGLAYRSGVQFDLALTAQGVRLPYPAGVRLQLDSNLGLTGTMQAALLRGSVRVDSIGFTPDFDVSTFMSQFTSAVAPPPSTQSFSQNMKLDVTVQSTGGLNVVSRTLSLQGGVDARIVGTAAEPVITGRANLTGGDMIFLSNRYVIQGGTVDFVSPVRTEPVVNVRASTSINQYNITLGFQGPVEQMRINYTSSPALPPAEIIHLIAFGSLTGFGNQTTTTEAGAQTSTPTSLAAESLLASAVTSQLTSGVAKIAGISQLSINPNLGGVGRNPGPIIALQQRVTSKLYVTFSTDVTSTQSQQVEVQYEVSPRWSVSGTRDQNGGFGFDARYHKDF